MKVVKASQISAIDRMVCWECHDENMTIDGFVQGETTILVCFDCGHSRQFRQDENVVVS